MDSHQVLDQVGCSVGEQEDISLADLEGSHNEILQRVAERVRHGDSASVSAGTHNSHSSSHHTSS
jgi:uncharacterized cupin superfamily protein